MSTEGAKAFAAVVLGVLAVLALPAAVGATELSEDVTLLQAGFAVPVALVLGVGAIVLARAVRARSRASIEGARLRVATTARVLGVVGVCIACSGAIALGFYALLVHLE
jgi:hypothetical protein